MSRKYPKIRKNKNGYYWEGEIMTDFYEIEFEQPFLEKLMNYY